MICTLSSIKVNRFFLLSPRHILSFVDPWSTMIRTISLIESEWNSLPSSSAKSLCFLDSLSRWYGQSCQLKVSESHLLVSSTKYVSFFDRGSTMISTMLPIDSNWNCLLSSSTEFVFCRSTVDKFSDTVADRKVSEIHFSVSSRKPLSFLTY